MSPRLLHHRSLTGLALVLTVVAVVMAVTATGMIIYRSSSPMSATPEIASSGSPIPAAPSTAATSTATTRQRSSGLAGPTSTAAPSSAARSSQGSSARAPAVATVTVTTTPPPATGRPATVTTTQISTTSVAPADMAALYRRVRSGVVKIETVSCTDAGIGTGFLLSSTLVATVEHVVHDAVTIDLISGGRHVTGTVIGSDATSDLALVRATEPIAGHRFRFSVTEPRVGDSVMTIGFPLNEPETLSHGVISGLHRRADVEGAQRSGMIQTDAPINPGNSGGPLLSADGSVLGLIDAADLDANGIGLAIPASQAAAADAAWADAPVVQQPADCTSPLGPTQQTAAVPPPSSGAASNAQMAGIIVAFETYFGGINSGDYAQAYRVLTPGEKAKSGEAAFAEGVSTSYDTDFAILGSRVVRAGVVDVGLAFTSIQAPDKGPDGDSCDNWTLIFRMVQQDDGRWLIGPATAYQGATHTSC